MQALTPSLLNQVLAVAEQAGEHLARFYSQSVAVQIKADKTPVTEADLFISQFVIEQLQQLTPNVPILSEESGKIAFAERAGWQEYWLIDPLDGTQQFIDRTDQFSVMISLVQQNRPVLGVIHAPILGKTYYAMKDFGAYLKQGEQIQPLCKKTAELPRLTITLGTSNSQRILNALQPPYVADFLQYGSSSLKAGLVAEGKADCYIRLGDTGEWDTAAAEVLLGELNGAIFDLNGKPLTYNQRETLVNPYFMMVGDRGQNWSSIFRFN